MDFLANLVYNGLVRVKTHKKGKIIVRTLSISSIEDVELMLSGGFFFAVRESDCTSAVSSMHIQLKFAVSRSSSMDEVVDLKEMQRFLNAHKKN